MIASATTFLSPENLCQMANAAVFSLLGFVLFAVAFVAIDKLTPYALWKEIVEQKNVALAIIVGSMSVAMALIVAAALL